MKYLSILVFFILCTLSCGPRAKLIVLTNSSENTLENGHVIVSANDFSVPEGMLLVLKDESGNVIPCQYDDLDGDDIWDELAFQVSLQANESKEVTFGYLPSDEMPEFAVKTDAYLGYSPDRDDNFQSAETNSRPADHVAQSQPYLYQFEGPAWESDKVAFRSYFDSRNGKDIFGKTDAQIIAKNVGLGENYHELQDWGMDILKVGSSLGAGALAILKNDSLYRLGPTDKARFEIVYEGPVRSKIRMTYNGWIVGDNTYSLKEEISIWAGQLSYESKVWLEGGTSGDTLVTGIVNLKENVKNETSIAGVETIYSHGKQSENNDMLGMGLIIPIEYFSGFGEAPKEGSGVTNTYLAYLKPAKGFYNFHFFSGWELTQADFQKISSFESALKDRANEITADITYKIVE